jgi:hypothetical protein
MHHVPPSVPTFDTEGLLFHIASLSDGILDGPRGIWINSEFVRKNPTLRMVKREEFTIYFIAFDPLLKAEQGSPLYALHQLIQQSPMGSTEKGCDVSVQVYVELKENVTTIKELLENAIDSGEDPPEVKALVHKVLSMGYECTREFIDNLRRDFNQYWLTLPSGLEWAWILYFSKDRQEWYSILAEKGFEPDNWGKDHKYSTPPRFGYILLRMVNSGDLPELAKPRTLLPQTVADEMIATALIDLSKGRTRSSILHGVIALESASKRALYHLLSKPIKEFSQTSVLDAISQEVSLPTLAQVVYIRTGGVEALPEIDWQKIRLIYNTRNTIVHRGQRRLPQFEPVKEQLLEIYKYVHGIERASR